MPMNGNINDPLNLKQDETTVAAEGWLQWGSADTAAVITVVVIDANGRHGSATTNCVRREGHDLEDWKVDLPSSDGTAFAKGLATGTVSAVVTTTGTPFVSWSRNIQLK